jgi:ribosomal RNA-processing protein 12
LQPSSRKPTVGDAFEDVLYGSESELEDSDDEDVHTAQSKSGKKTMEQGARLRLDDDEPMDLLQGAAGNVISTSPSISTIIIIISHVHFLNRCKVKSAA